MGSTPTGRFKFPSALGRLAEAPDFQSGQASSILAGHSLKMLLLHVAFFDVALGSLWEESLVVDQVAAGSNPVRGA